MSEQKSFEALLMELEAKVDNLEQGGLTLEESLDDFEKAMAMLQSLRLQLDKAQQKVQVLHETGDAFELTAFEADEEHDESR